MSDSGVYKSITRYIYEYEDLDMFVNGIGFIETAAFNFMENTQVPYAYSITTSITIAYPEVYCINLTLIEL